MVKAETVAEWIAQISKKNPLLGAVLAMIIIAFGLGFAQLYYGKVDAAELKEVEAKIDTVEKKVNHMHTQQQLFTQGMDDAMHYMTGKRFFVNNHPTLPPREYISKAIDDNDAWKIQITFDSCMACVQIDSATGRVPWACYPSGDSLKTIHGLQVMFK
jgi:hypothetical protein